MRRICLDTCAYSQFKRGHPAAVQVVTSAPAVGMPTIVLGELRTGFRLGAKGEKNEDELQAFLSNPVVRVLDVDDEAAHIYADLVVDLRKQGTPLPTNDIWIASLAVRDGATVITFDSHFEAIRRAGTMVLGRR